MTSVIPSSQAHLIPGVKKAKPNKFNAKPVVIDGRRFDSTVEGKYYAALKLRERAGEVYGLRLQPEFVLHAPNGKPIAKYRADFAWWDSKEDRFVCVDVKGFDTPLSRHKRKHVEAEYGVHVEIVGKGGL